MTSSTEASLADQRIEWGKAEHFARLSDIAAVKAGSMSLAHAQANARRRSRLSGMTPTEAHRALADGQRALNGRKP